MNRALTVILFFAGLLLGLGGCSGEKKSTAFHISTNRWIGYTPLIYAQQKGWLEPYGITVTQAVSLHESMRLFKDGYADAITATQYEYDVLKFSMPSLVPIMLIDRSNGGDMILSTQTPETFFHTRKPIYAYLEVDSVNTIMLHSFMLRFGINSEKITPINLPQNRITELTPDDVQNPALIVTYAPYQLPLQNRGFKVLTTSRECTGIFIVDALFTTLEKRQEHRYQLEALHALFEKAQLHLRTDPAEFFATVKPFFGEVTFEEFTMLLSQIEWLDSGAVNTYASQLPSTFPTRYLVRP